MLSKHQNKKKGDTFQQSTSDSKKNVNLKGILVFQKIRCEGSPTEISEFPYSPTQINCKTAKLNSNF